MNSGHTLADTGKTIRYIYHIADIHIRIGNNEIARIEEYSDVFEKFYQILKSESDLKISMSVLVIAGDIFHNKCRMESGATKMLFAWINKLLDILPILVICGNHDYKQDEPELTDSIEMFVEPYTNVKPNRLFYLKETGHYIFENIGIGTVSVKDTLKHFNTAGIIEQLPEFPSPDALPTPIKIAIFHGCVSDSKHFNKVYPIEWLSKYKFVLLGDNHKQQIKAHTDKCKYGYPGSMIQQDFGENLESHGYLLWDLQTEEVTGHHIPNKYGSITIEDGIVVDSDKTVLDPSKIPEHPKIRIVGKANESFKELLERASLIKYVTQKVSLNTPARTSLNCDINNPQTWEKYIQEDKLTPIIKSAIYTPRDILLIPTQTETSTSILEMITKRNAVIQGFLDEYNTTTENSSNKKLTIHFKNLKWDYLMCYGKNNHFNFERCDDKIVLINGLNACGKSSFLDIICISIYGEPTPSRKEFTGNKMTSKIINDQKPANETSYTEIEVKLNDTVYVIYRNFTCQNDPNLLKERKCSVKKLDATTNEYTIVAEGTSKVDKWVKEHFGTLEDTLMSTILCQSDISNFFYKKPCEQTQILEKALNMSSITAYLKVLEESIKGYKYVIDKLSSYTQGMTESVTEVNETELTNLKEYSKDLQTRIITLKTQCKTLLLQMKDDPNKYSTALSEAHITALDSESKSESEANESKSEANESKAQSDAHSALLEQLEFLNNSIKEIKAKLNSEALNSVNANSEALASEAVVTSIDDINTEITIHLNTEPPKPLYSLQYITNKEKEYAEWSSIQIYKKPKIARQRLELLKTYLLEFTESITRDMYSNSEFTSNIPEDISELIRTYQKYKELYETCKHIKLDSEALGDSGAGNNSEAKDSGALGALSKADIGIIEDKIRKLDDQLQELYDNPVEKIKGVKIEESVNDTTPEIKLRLLREKISKLEMSCSGVCKDMSKKKEWDAKWEEWTRFAETVPKESIEELKEIQSKIDEYNKILKREEEYTTEISELKDFEFNPECWACCKQPKMIRLQALTSALKIIVKKKNKHPLNSKTTDVKDNITIKERYNMLYKTMEEQKAEWDSAIEEHSKRQELDRLKGKCYAVYQTLVNKKRSQRTQLEQELKDYARLVYHKYEHARTELNKVYNSLVQDIAQLTKFFNEYEAYKKDLMIISQNKENAEKWEEWNESIQNLYKLKSACEYKSCLNLLNEKQNEYVKVMTKLANVYFYKETQLRQLETELSDITTKIAQMDYSYEYIKKHPMALQIHQFIAQLTNTLEHLQQFHVYFVGNKTVDGFKQWVYSSVVIPRIEEEINKFLSCIDTFQFKITAKNNGFVYTLSDRESTPTLDHASGYQKFIIGLAMRVTLARIGSVGQNVKHLFIDEGFVACDHININKTHDILNIIKNIADYKNIIIMSHLESIKELADLKVNIERDTSKNISRLRYT